jgi:hypothetical protein
LVTRREFITLLGGAALGGAREDPIPRRDPTRGQE